MRIIPYLNFDGGCREAMTFYHRVLGGEITDMIAHADFPMEGNDPSPEWQDKILHARLVVGDFELMGSDCPPDSYTPPGNMYVSLHPDTPADAERIYHALEDGAKTIEMPISEVPWAQRFGVLTDRYGIPWMINCDRS